MWSIVLHPNTVRLVFTEEDLFGSMLSIVDFRFGKWERDHLRYFSQSASSGSSDWSSARLVRWETNFLDSFLRSTFVLQRIGPSVNKRRILSALFFFSVHFSFCCSLKIGSNTCVFYQRSPFPKRRMINRKRQRDPNQSKKSNARLAIRYNRNAGDRFFSLSPFSFHTQNDIFFLSFSSIGIVLMIKRKRNKSILNKHFSSTWTFFDCNPLFFIIRK